MMNFTRFAGFDDQAYLGAKALADEVVMHGRGSEQGGDGNVFGIQLAIGQNQDVVAVVNRLFGRVQRALSAGSMPAAPVSAAYTMLRVLVLNAPAVRLSMRRIFSRSWLVRIGWWTSSRL